MLLCCGRATPAVPLCEIYVIIANIPPIIKKGIFSNIAFRFKRFNGQTSISKSINGNKIVVGFDIKAITYTTKLPHRAIDFFLCT